MIYMIVTSLYNSEKAKMDDRKKIPPVLLFLALLAFIVGPVYSAFGTIDKIAISAPSSAPIGQPIQVQATVYTERSG